MRKIAFLICLFLSLLAIDATAEDGAKKEAVMVTPIGYGNAGSEKMRGPQSLPVITVIYDTVAETIEVQCSDESTFDIRVYNRHGLLIGMSDSSCPTVEGIRSDGPISVQILSEHWQAEVTL